MKNAIISVIVAALVASGATYAGTSHLFMSRVTVIHSSIVSVAPHSRGFATADCPSAQTATGGGLTSSDIAGSGAIVTDSAPAPITGTVALGWTVTVQNPTDSPLEIRAYAVCVR